MIFDIVVLVALLMSCIIAFLRGFIREVLTILGVLGGGLAGLAFGPKLAPQMRHWLGVVDGVPPKKLFDIIPYTILADILAYGAIFIVVVIILSIVSHLLANGAKAMGLGALDRSLGVVFGIARALVLLALLYLPVYILVDKDGRDNLFKGSRTRVYVETMSAEIASRLPASFSDRMQQKTDEARDALTSATRKKLLSIDVLPADKKNKTAEGLGKTTTDNGPGYEDNSRETMQDLIEKEVQDKK